MPCAGSEPSENIVHRQHHPILFVIVIVLTAKDKFCFTIFCVLAAAAPVCTKVTLTVGETFHHDQHQRGYRHFLDEHGHCQDYQDHDHGVDSCDDDNNAGASCFCTK